MQDSIIKGTGNSRYLKGAGWPATYEEFKSMAEAGTLPIDLAGINAAGWQQIGMAFAKATMLSDTTAAKYFASLVGTESVDQVLSLLGRFHGGMGNEYVWAKQQYIEFLSANGSNYTLFNSPDSTAFYYTDSIDISSSGDITLHNPTTTTVWGVYSSDSVLQSLKGKYVQCPGYSTAIVKINSNATFSSSGSSNRTATVTGSSTVTSQLQLIGYVNSPDSNAHPPSESDGFTYTPLGQIGSKVQIATGSYTGTGAYGSSNPTVINTGNQNTKILFVFRSDGAFAGIFLSGLSSGIVIATDGSTSVQRAVSSDANGIFSIYHATTAAYQFNQSGFTYKFISIG